MSLTAHDPMPSRAGCPAAAHRRVELEAAPRGTACPMASAARSPAPAGRAGDVSVQAAGGWWAFKAEALAMAARV